MLAKLKLVMLFRIDSCWGFFATMALPSILVACFPSPAIPQDIGVDQELLDRLVLEIEPIERQYNNTSGRVVYESLSMHPEIELSDGRVLAASRREGRYEISFSARDRLVKRVTSEKEIEVIEVANSEYAFALTRPKNGAYSIATIIQSGGSDLEDADVERKRMAALAMPLGAYSILGRPVGLFVRDPEFEITGLRSYDNGKGERVRIDFRYTLQHAELDPSLAFSVKEGHVVLLPQENWRVSGYCYNDNDHSDKDFSYSIKTVADPPAGQLALMSYRGIMDEETGSARYIKQVEYSYELIPKEEFYLSFYGFTEPKFGGNHHYWSWIALCSLLGGGLLIVARRLLKRPVPSDE